MKECDNSTREIVLYCVKRIFANNTTLNFFNWNIFEIRGSQDSGYEENKSFDMRRRVTWPMYTEALLTE
jgi:hypothetical protein